MDLIIVLVKSPQTAEAIAAAAPIIGPATMVMSLQNGLGHETILSDAVGGARVIAGKTYVGGVMLAPGRVQASSAGKVTVIGQIGGGAGSRVTAIAETFNRAGLETSISANILGTIWDKLLINVATGALSAITGLTYGPLYEVPEIEDTAIAAVAEAIAVASMLGMTLSSTDPRNAWDKAAAGLPGNFKTSMLQSLEKQSRTEIDFINGAVVAAGECCGVATPVNRTLAACIKGIERRIVPQTAPGNRSYVEHAAIRVRDIGWHIRFLREVLGMSIRDVDGPADAPRQVWTTGGVQLIADPDFNGPEGRLAHLGVMTEDLEAAIRAAANWGVTTLAQGPNWLQLPDGLGVELLQASGQAVGAALAINPRA